MTAPSSPDPDPSAQRNAPPRPHRRAGLGALLLAGAGAVIALGLVGRVGGGGSEEGLRSAEPVEVRAEPTVEGGSAVIPAASRMTPLAPREPLLPRHRIVTYYGNPLSQRMGILGAIPPDSMIRLLREQADAFARVDPERPVLPALHLVTVVAQRDAGSDGMYRSRMRDAVVEQVMGWAEPDSMLVFLDIQPGRSTVEAEVRAYERFLVRPHVHLALDPEFAMGPDQLPGRVIGSITAEEVNWAIEYLAGLVEAHGLPPKVLVVHRFTQGMLRGHDRIRLDPRVQVVIAMDGIGAPALKRSSYRAVITREPVQFAGFKLFYTQDVPLMSPADVLALDPIPFFIVYQ
jgi:hypothetical protein